MDKSGVKTILIYIGVWWLLVGAFLLGTVAGDRIADQKISASVSRVVPDNQIAGMGN